MRNDAYERQDRLEKAAEPVGTKYLCPRCEGYGTYSVGENLDPGGTGEYEQKDCEVCNGSGVIVLRKIKEPS